MHPSPTPLSHRFLSHPPGRPGLCRSPRCSVNCRPARPSPDEHITGRRLRREHCSGRVCPFGQGLCRRPRCSDECRPARSFPDEHFAGRRFRRGHCSGRVCPFRPRHCSSPRCGNECRLARSSPDEHFTGRRFRRDHKPARVYPIAAWQPGASEHFAAFRPHLHSDTPAASLAPRRLLLIMASGPAGPLAHQPGVLSPRREPHSRDLPHQSFWPRLLPIHWPRRYPSRPNATAPSP